MLVGQNIIGIGVDMVYVDRIAAVHNKSPQFAQKILSANEFDIFNAKEKHAQIKYLARRWCAKEAVFKAMPGARDLTSNAKYIEILNDSTGKPYVNLLGNLHQHMLMRCCNRKYSDTSILEHKYSIYISISDEVNSAIAFCIISCDAVNAF